MTKRIMAVALVVVSLLGVRAAEADQVELDPRGQIVQHELFLHLRRTGIQPTGQPN